jgi:hypothetical protein
MAIENTLKKALETAPTPEPEVTGLEPVTPAKRTFLWMPRVLGDRYAAPGWHGRKRLRAGVRKVTDSLVEATKMQCWCGKVIPYTVKELENGTVKKACCKAHRKGKF